MVEFFGYDAPPGAVEASSTVMANNGAPKLASFLNGIDAAREHGAGDAHIAVAAHSYGSTTAGIAATLVGDGVIDDLVQFGSPGSGVQDVGEFHVPEGHTYVSAACAPFFGGSMSPRSALRSNPSRPSSATSSPPSSPHAMSFSLLRTSWRTKTAIKSTLIPKVAKPSVLSSHALFSSPSWTRTISATPKTSTCCPSDSNSPNNAGHRAASNS